MTCNEFVPKTPKQFSYDADCNLLSDGQLNYTWDAEDRLAKLTPSTAVGMQSPLTFEHGWTGHLLNSAYDAAMDYSTLKASNCLHVWMRSCRCPCERASDFSYHTSDVPGR
jgi:hypothetical protein